MAHNLRDNRILKAATIRLTTLFLLLMLTTSCSVTGSDDGNLSEAVEPNNQQANLSSLEEVPIRGRLSFIRSESLTFDTAGEIGSILTKEGDRVKKGKVLAQLDSISIAKLNHLISQNKRDLNKARDNLAIADQTFETTPADRILHYEEIAKAKIALESAEIDLDNFQRTYYKSLANATNVEAKAQVTLRKSIENLDDFERNHEKSLASALKLKTDSETSLEKANLALKNFARDEKQLLDAAMDIESAAALTLEIAQEALSDFMIDYEQELSTAQKAVGTEEEDLETAVDAVSNFLHNPQDRDVKDGTYWDLEALARLRIKVDLAEADLAQAKANLDRIQDGPNSLKEQDLKTAVNLSESKLKKAQDDVEDLSDGVDDIKLAQRKAAIKVAENTLEQATIDLSKEEKGPDLSDRAQLQSDIKVAESALADATADLSRKLTGPDSETLELKKTTVDKKTQELVDLTDGPDKYEVDVKQTALTLALVNLDHSIEELRGTSITAPFDGIISLVNASKSDIVSTESKIIEITDPGEPEIIATVDASKSQAIKTGNPAEITLSSLPNTTLDGVVTHLAQNPDTERGIVGYELRISITVPDSIEIPLQLATATAIVYP